MNFTIKPGAVDAGDGVAVAGLSRRQFLKVTALAGGGLLISWQLGSRLAGAEPALATASPTPFAPNPFLRITPDGAVTVLSKHSEMGQGAYTSLAMCAAEELDADWSQVRVEAAPGGSAYAHTIFGMQMTGGSTSTWEAYQQMREAGATARALLVQAAAQKWKTEEAQLKTENSFVIAPDGRRASYGELCSAAAQVPMLKDVLSEKPPPVKLKDPAQFKLIGKPTHRVDSLEKVNGKGVFGIDVRVPGALVAMLARPPVFGGKVRSVDATEAKTIPGVKNVIETSRGVAVLATHTHAARKGRDALKIEWDHGANASFDSERQRTEYAALAKEPGAMALKTGDAATAFSDAATKIEAEFDFPYLAHAAMEPLNATAHVKSDGTVEIWAPTQFQGVDMMNAAKVAGTQPAKVTLHTTLLGGGFGRKATPTSDFIVEAVEISKLAGGPVQVVWTREDDMRGGYYRPRTWVTAKLGLDAAGKLTSWENQIVSQSISQGTAFESMMLKDGVDATQVEGLADLPYAVPHVRVDYHMAPMVVPVLWWRSVGHTFSAFVKETLIDDAARAAKQDPIDYRIELLAEHPRQIAVLKLLREKSNWGRAPQGRFQGVAIQESFGSIVGEVAEISLAGGDAITVHKVTAVVDCGTAVNPDGVRAQMMSGVIFGLSAALHGKITFKNGQVEQSNFHDYPVLRMNEAPVVETHIINSGAKMGGIGEPGTPPIAPAVANAVLVATGKRVRSLPISLTA